MGMIMPILGVKAGQFASGASKELGISDRRYRPQPCRRLKSEFKWSLLEPWSVGAPNDHCSGCLCQKDFGCNNGLQ
jgi:hypothetical protein